MNEAYVCNSRGGTLTNKIVLGKFNPMQDRTPKVVLLKLQSIGFNTAARRAQHPTYGIKFSLTLKVVRRNIPWLTVPLQIVCGTHVDDIPYLRSQTVPTESALKNTIRPYVVGPIAYVIGTIASTTHHHKITRNTEILLFV